MIIDMILDRKDGQSYDPVEFFNYIHEDAKIFPKSNGAKILLATYKSEQHTKHELCAYVLEQGYNPEICDFINSVCWLPDWWDFEPFN